MIRLLIIQVLEVDGNLLQQESFIKPYLTRVILSNSTILTARSTTCTRYQSVKGTLMTKYQFI